jgi:hypothetical protein
VTVSPAGFGVGVGAMVGVGTTACVGTAGVVGLRPLVTEVDPETRAVGVAAVVGVAAGTSVGVASSVVVGVVPSTVIGVVPSVVDVTADTLLPEVWSPPHAVMRATILIIARVDMITLIPWQIRSLNKLFFILIELSLLIIN